jgi:hypothetical protein
MATIPPGVRRDMAVRRNLDKYGDPMEMLAKLAGSGDKEAARALLPFYYPSLKAVELSGPGGDALTVQVIKLAAPATP